MCLPHLPHVREHSLTCKSQPVILFWCNTNKPAYPYHAVALCVSTFPVAALNHLRGGESILPLPQPASLSVAENTFRSLIETTKTWAACSTCKRKQDRKFDMIRHGRCHQMCCVAADPELFKECRGQSVQNSRERQVLLESLPGSSTGAADEVSRRAKSIMATELHESPSVRPSSKAVDFARKGSLGYSSRATGTSQKSAGCMGCVHQVCRLKIRSPEGTIASFASVGRSTTNQRWMM